MPPGRGLEPELEQEQAVAAAARPAVVGLQSAPVRLARLLGRVPGSAEESVLEWVRGSAPAPVSPLRAPLESVPGRGTEPPLLAAPGLRLRSPLLLGHHSPRFPSVR